MTEIESYRRSGTVVCGTFRIATAAKTGVKLSALNKPFFSKVVAIAEKGATTG